MRSKISLIAAPTAMSPGGYVAKAYASRTAPNTSAADVAVEKAGAVWRVRMAWACAEPVRAIGDDVDRFVDAAAVVAPTVPEANWMTMGAPGQAVEGALWRADRETLFGVRAEGLGSVQRADPPEGWQARAEWRAGQWSLELELRDWPVLDARGQLAVAIWQGAMGDRAGLKSVSPGWLEVGS